MAKPNVVMILVDDMGYGDFGVFSDGRTVTPNLDRLVGEGVCLTQHYAASCVCNPSRASLLTGRYPHRTGSVDTLDWRGLDRLALREVTLADVLRQAGYATGLMGKWHLGALDPRYHPQRRGFGEFVGFRGGWQDYYRWNLDEGDHVRPADGRYLTDVLSDEAVDFIGRHREEPFFLNLCYNAPHTPLQAPEEDIQPFTASGRFNKGLCILYGMIRRMDAGLGRVLAALDRHGLTENTILWFSSDNGPQFSGTGEMCIRRPNCGFHGNKGTVYEGGIRVPAVVRWPAGLSGARHEDAMVHMTDWLPTLCSMVGVDAPRDVQLDGVDSSDVLRGEACKAPTRRFWQWNRYTPVMTSNAAFRDGDWKLVRPAIAESMHIPEDDLRWNSIMRYEPERLPEIVRAPEPARVVPAPGPPELYNLADDPLEQVDLADSEPDRARRMLTELESWFEEVESERRTIQDAW